MHSADLNIDNHQKITPLYYSIILICIVWNALLITNGTLNFFGLEKFGLVYNDFFLSLWDGRLDLTPAVIGDEGFYALDGRVYTYFGFFPALLRLPFHFFVDLATVPVSRVIVFASSIGIAAISQSILHTVMRHASKGYGWSGKLYLSSTLLIWLASPTLILCANGSVYHEPIALGLLGVMLFAWIVLRGMLVRSESAPGNMTALAIIAGIMLHTRPTMAIALYFGVTLFCLLHAYQGYVRFRTEHGPLKSAVRAIFAPKTVVAPMLILFAFGCLLLFLNWVKWGAPFDPAPLERYGFILNGEGLSGRHLAVKQHGRFSIRRIIPGAIFHLTGVGMGGYAHSVYDRLTGLFGTGTMRLEDPAPLLLMWSPWFFAALFTFGKGRKEFTKQPETISYFILATTLLIPMLLMFSYPTITVRYKAEFWPFLFLGLCVLFAAKGRVSPTQLHGGFIRFFAWWSVFSACVSMAESVAYRTAWVSHSSDSWVMDLVLHKIRTII
ncbi:hypothetical protein BerOc1_03662 [Pseudodesulfovibrio hydrargyri]|uniref:Glycosyltransferase RgtA/B/C/D-like domain-containing protein n=1 Tax=Pseudodesulfovibrio hydrargyri TaxID=2125990 RepID=A0A1J5MQL3_9BACT|nr:hypothetical protein [Pseudodesulfovibrio hydrargyri]OIQ48909.1 hypothetical protein BerOc1_03662 [Pseudodesulfovibrio hydrargyri]